jgi:hypothetical protein
VGCCSTTKQHSTSTGSTRQFEDCRQYVTWSGWYPREENENTRKLRSALMATPTQSSETLIMWVYFETN